MFLKSGYNRIVCVLVKSGFLQTVQGIFQRKSLTFLSLGWHVPNDFMLDVLWQHVLQNASLLKVNTLEEF